MFANYMGVTIVTSMFSNYMCITMVISLVFPSCTGVTMVSILEYY